MVCCEHNLHPRMALIEQIMSGHAEIEDWLEKIKK
jgi:hypothetical protein